MINHKDDLNVSTSLTFKYVSLTKEQLHIKQEARLEMWSSVHQEDIQKKYKHKVSNAL